MSVVLACEYNRCDVGCISMESIFCARTFSLLHLNLSTHSDMTIWDNIQILIEAAFGPSNAAHGVPKEACFKPEVKA